MPATPKSLRQSPARNFSNYTLVYETSPDIGLFPVKNEELEYVSGDTGTSAGYNVLSPEIEIGFDFNLDEVDYDRIVVSTYGWAALAEKDSAFSVSDCFAGSFWDEPSKIYVAHHTLLAPWFTQDIKNNYRYLQDASVPDITADEKQQFGSGMATIDSVRQNWFDSSAGGIKIHRGNSQKGRYLLVRWTSIWTNSLTDKTALRFDLVIYESGIIEYRYAPHYKLVETDVAHDTAVGIWVHSNVGDTNYRDFSNYLKVDKPFNPGAVRPKYRYGGAVYNGAYTDDVSPYPKYSISINHVDHWPAKGINGAVFRLAPPVSKRRNNKRSIATRDSILISQAGTFDDRKTNYFLSDTTSYPAGLQIRQPFSTSYKGVHRVLDLFSLQDLEVTRTGSSAMYDQLLEETQEEFPDDGFKEIAQHEQGMLEDAYFSSGSISYGKEPGDFTSKIDKKAVVRMSLPVKTSIQMFGTSSCIYYYNRTFSRWNLPTSSYGDICNAFDKFSFNTDWPTAHGTGIQPYTVGSLLPEDGKGFNSYGLPIGSGSYDIHRKVEDKPDNFNQTISWIGKSNVSNSEMLEAISERQSKSINQSANYLASQDELLEIPIDGPFLLEKAVLNFNIEAGPGWLKDRTTTTPLFVDSIWALDPTDSNLYTEVDQGGPVLTAALFCRKKFGNAWIMDLICSGTITHEEDAITLRAKAYRIDASPVSDPRVSGDCVIVTQNGFDQAGTVVPYQLSGQFTGSVTAKMTPSVSNGINVCHTKTFLVNTSPAPPAVDPAVAIEWFRNVVTSSSYAYDSMNYGEDLRVIGVNSLGRAMLGFKPGGSSIFGGENVTHGNKIGTPSIFSSSFYTSNHYIANDTFLHVSSSIDTQATLHGGSNVAVIFTSNVTFNGDKIAPYLMHPGDKLVLCISKTRPAYNHVRGLIANSSDANTGKRDNLDDGLKLDYDDFVTPNNFLPLVPHDIKLSTGSIDISLYGSYVSENRGRS